MPDNELKNQRVAVIGAGPAGMTAAYALAKAGVRVVVFEAAPVAGGLARTIELWGQRVDLGPHRFFSTDTRVNQLWLEVAGSDFEMVDRLTRIYYKGKFFYYPLRPFDAFFKLGPFEAARCVWSYLCQKFSSPPAGGSFESWVVGRFGRRLFEIFFKTYSEKLWGIPCTELDADFAAQRIKKLSLYEAVKNALVGGKGNRHKTLVDQFAYPHDGTGMIYERMADFVRQHDGEVRFETPVQRVLQESGRVTGLELEGGQVESFDHVVSTMPLTLMVSRLPSVPENILERVRALTFRNTILVYLEVGAKDLFPDNWLYVHASDMQMGRLTNFRNWVPQICGESPNSIMVLEYWCYDEDPVWSEKDEALVALGTRELQATGLIGEAPVLQGQVHRIRRCYPVYSRGYKDHLKPVEAYLDGIEGLSVIGRYGSFKYNNQDHSILMGLLAAENIAQGTRHNLWEINTDYEDYQEASVITQTGLQKKSDTDAD